MAHFASRNGAWRSRSVGGRVLAGRIDLPRLPSRLQADLATQTREDIGLEVGDVEMLPLARARTRWPDYRLCVAEAGRWLAAQGLPHDLPQPGAVALMACRGARYHHDGARYGGAAFFNVFVSDDCGLDLHFAAAGLRMPLQRGTAVVFDTCQPHGVIRRGSAGFEAHDFAPSQDWTQYFLTWELPIEHAALAAALGVVFDVEPASAVSRSQLLLNGRPAAVSPASGAWVGAGPSGQAAACP